MQGCHQSNTAKCFTVKKSRKVGVQCKITTELNTQINSNFYCYQYVYTSCVIFYATGSTVGLFIPASQEVINSLCHDVTKATNVPDDRNFSAPLYLFIYLFDR